MPFNGIDSNPRTHVENQAMTRMLPASDKLFDYIVRIGAREHPVLKRCREETAGPPMPGCRSRPEQGAFLRCWRSSWAP